MKASLVTICLVAVSLLAEAQTAKPKPTAAATRPKTVATAQKKTTTTGKPNVAAKKPAPKPPVATAPAATTTAVASVTATAEPAPVLAQQTVVETKPEVEASANESKKRSKKVKEEKPEKVKVAKAEKPAKPEKPARVKTESAYSGKGLSIGIRGGVNALLNEFNPGVEGTEAGQSETSPGFTGGLIINYGVGNVFSIQPEILYTRRSVKFAGEESGQKFSLKASFNAVEIPLLLKLSFGRKTRFFVNAGPYVSYGLDGRAKFVVDGQTIIDEKQKLTSDDARLEYGVTGGLGVSIPAGPGSILIEGRYNYSLGNNADPKPAEYVSQQVATFSVGYLFPLGRR
ncbi:porin family protein [Larkinella rosea]|uniref:PorT family protein n=1 Tax=Larkinella rosea TaxID=2025312 RepID=A0A3P1BNA1_9BACT|nr:porin family protein [Larkinella rosea]RRB02620.1 PorT family protein [Larkinella rosea]